MSDILKVLNSLTDIAQMHYTTELAKSKQKAEINQRNAIAERNLQATKERDQMKMTYDNSVRENVELRKRIDDSLERLAEYNIAVDSMKGLDEMLTSFGSGDLISGKMEEHQGDIRGYSTDFRENENVQKGLDFALEHNSKVLQGLSILESKAQEEINKIGTNIQALGDDTLDRVLDLSDYIARSENIGKEEADIKAAQLADEVVKNTKDTQAMAVNQVQWMLKEAGERTKATVFVDMLYNHSGDNYPWSIDENYIEQAKETMVKGGYWVADAETLDEMNNMDFSNVISLYNKQMSTVDNPETRMNASLKAIKDYYSPQGFGGKVIASQAPTMEESLDMLKTISAVDSLKGKGANDDVKNYLKSMDETIRAGNTNISSKIDDEYLNQIGNIDFGTKYDKGYYANNPAAISQAKADIETALNNLSSWETTISSAGGGRILSDSEMKAIDSAIEVGDYQLVVDTYKGKLGELDLIWGKGDETEGTAQHFEALLNQWQLLNDYEGQLSSAGFSMGNTNIKPQTNNVNKLQDKYKSNFVDFSITN